MLTQNSTLKMSFKENLLRKLELEGLALKVIGSLGTDKTRHHIDKEAMRSLLELSPYHHRHERDLDLYIKNHGGEVKSILVLDNELPIFRSTVKDVVTRRSPKTLEMWKISTIRHILVDSDIKESTGEESVKTVLKDAVGELNLTYSKDDIVNLAREGMAWLAGKNFAKVEEILSLFAAMLGYRKPPKQFGLDHTVTYGAAATGAKDETVFGPMVMYRHEDNSLLWLDKTFSTADREQLKFLRSTAAGQTSAPITGEAVFDKLKDMVHQKPERVQAALAGTL